MNLLRKYIQFNQKYKYFILLFWIFLFITCIPFIFKLKVKPNFKDLLPLDAPSVVGLNKLIQIYGGEGFFMLGLERKIKYKPIPTTNTNENKNTQQKNRNDLINFSKLITEQIYENTNLVKNVVYHLDIEFFKSNFLLHMDLADLKEIENRINKKIDSEKKNANPFYVDLLTKEYTLNFDDIKSKYNFKQFTEYFLNKSNDMIILLIKPQKSANDVKFVRNLVNNIQSNIFYIQSNYDSLKDIKPLYGGPYYEVYLDNAEIEEDIKKLSILSISCILVVLFLFYGSIRPILIILPSIILGLTINLALTQILINHLNLLSGFLSGILMGLGLDFGIHLYSRYELEKIKDRKNKKPRDITTLLTHVVWHSGIASFGGSVTTAAAFYSLSIAEFRGFSEFGIIAGNGMIITGLSVFLLFPLLVIFTDTLFEYFPFLKFRSIRFSRISFSPFYFLIKKHRYILIIICTFIILLSFYGSSFISFDYDFSKMRGKSLTLQPFIKKAEEIIGTTVRPCIIIVEDKQTLKELSKDISHIIGTKKGDTILFKQDIMEFIPKNQEEKIKIIQRLSHTYKKYNPFTSQYLQFSDNENNNLLEYALTPKVVNIENLPTYIKNEFVSEDNQYYFILIHPKSHIHLNINDQKIFSEQILNLNTKADKTKYQVTGIGIILGEIIVTIFKDGPTILLTALLVIFFITLLIFRNIRDIFVVFLSLLICTTMTLTFMLIFNVQFNILNLICIPTILGISVDSTIHICFRMREKKPKEDIYESVSHIARAIVISSITTLLGFGTLVFAGFKGLQTIGIVIIISIFAILIVSLIILPVFLPIFYKNSK